jgi:hypothetical protein
MPTPSPIGQLALAWLSSREGGAGAPGELKKALAGFSKLAAPGALAAALDDAAAQGLLTRARGKLTLTDAGRAEATRFTGAERAPWSKVRGPALLEKVLDLPPGKRDADGLRAALIAREHQLGPGAASTLTRAADALGWKLLGIDRDVPFTRGNVLTALIERAGGAAGAGKDLEATLRQLAARAVEARGAGSAQLRDAVLRRWLGGAAPAPKDDGDDLESFARRVNEAARAAESGRFGDNKVFISHVHRRIGGALDDFKARLIEAHRGGLVSLSRADLVEAMDPVDVRESETRYLSATYHFVRVEGSTP